MKKKFKVSYDATFFNGIILSGVHIVYGLDDSLTREIVERHAMENVVDGFREDNPVNGPLTFGLKKIQLTVTEIK